MKQAPAAAWCPLLQPLRQHRHGCDLKSLPELYDHRLTFKQLIIQSNQADLHLPLLHIQGLSQVTACTAGSGLTCTLPELPASEGTLTGIEAAMSSWCTGPQAWREDT